MRTKFFLSLLFGVFSFFTAAAQTSSLTATVVDQNGVALPGAVVELAPVLHPERTKYFTAGYGGTVLLSGVAYGDYTLTTSFLGYENAVQPVRVAARRQPLGRISLQESAVQLEAIVKEVPAMRTSQRGDTLAYNASAFKVTADADVEGLLKKMPGLTVSNGTVEAQGETVQKIFVDGKEFFGEDVTTAIKSLPAESVDRIEIYDKLSDQAEFSGVDDGEGYKALNIVTREKMRQGVFGQVYAGYGYDAEKQSEARNKYLVGGNVNWFTGQSRLSLLALFNNVNQQNFSFEDILGVTGQTGRGGGGRGTGQYMVRQQSGVATANAVGVNYSDTWGHRDQVTFQGSYFFNGTRTVNHARVDRWYESPAPIDTLGTDGYSRTQNYNNRLNARIEWKISDNQSLMIRPSLSFQSNDPYSTTAGTQIGQSGYSVIDNFEQAFRHGYNANTSATYRIRLGKPGRTLTVDGFFFYRDSQREQNAHSNIAESDADEPLRLTYQRTDDPSKRWRANIRASYTEPLTQYSQLTATYRYSYEDQRSDERTWTTAEDYGTTGLSPDPLLSSTMRSGYTIHAIGPGYNYSRNKTTLTAHVNYQRSTLHGNVTGSSPILHRYNNLTYMVRARIYLDAANSLNFRLRSYTDDPDVNDLSTAYDLSNAQYIRSGNPLLQPEYTHSLRMHYIRSNVQKGRTFMVMAGASTTSDYISTATRYNADLAIGGATYRPLQYTQPVNLSGYWDVRSMISYGFPIWKTNLNLRAGVSYAVIPTLEESVRNRAGNMGYSAGVVLGSNVSERVDFTVSWDGTYNEAANSSSSAGANRYFYHNTSLNFKFIFGAGFSLTGSAAYSQYRGFTTNYNDDYLLCNLFVGKKVLKQMGEISVGVNDLLNQNRAFARTTGSGWTQNARNSVLGRYYSIKFVYNLRFFGSKGSRNPSDYPGSTPAAQPAGMPAGMPPRGMMPHGMMSR